MHWVLICLERAAASREAEEVLAFSDFITAWLVIAVHFVAFISYKSTANGR